MSAFETWLSAELRNLNADEEVFRFIHLRCPLWLISTLRPYIVSILDEEEDEDSRAEALADLLQGFLDQHEDRERLAKAILDRRRKEEDADGEKVEEVATAVMDMDLNQRLSSIAESQTAAYNASRTANAQEGPDEEVKKAILAAVANAEAADEAAGGEDSEEGSDVAPRNQNAESVAREEAERREKSRLASAAKREKDKEDREKQKKAAEDKKKKAQEKTQKQERRR